MYKEIELRITPEEAHDREIVNELLAMMLHVGQERIVHVEILRKSIDARQRRVVIQLKVGVIWIGWNRRNGYLLPNTGMFRLPGRWSWWVPDRPVCLRLYA